ncbi:MAG TPA: hypothetical protein VNZ47_03530 [Candidatus Dormibacteraeota bacterium]|nr:hypothetical protein [Candidatus Dormibacteraeota bacterium]
MIEKFNFYDIYGYLLPGAVVLLLFWLPIGMAQHKWPSGDWTSALLGAALAYIAGVLLQTFVGKLLPPVVGTAGTGDDKHLRYPSERLLDPFQPQRSWPPQLSDCVREQVADAIDQKLGIERASLALDGIPDKKADFMRNEAFFLARHYLILRKGTGYTEQFEGMYALTSALATAFALATAYYFGWALNVFKSGWIPFAAVLTVTVGLLVAVNATALLFLTKKWFSILQWTAAGGVLMTALGMGYDLGHHCGITHWLAAALALAAIAALLASLRCYGFYREFIEYFAITIWRGFLMASKQKDPPGDAQKNKG